MRIASLAGSFALLAVDSITTPEKTAFLGMTVPWNKVPLASFAGSFGALTIVYGLSTARRRGTSAIVLLLGGVTVQALLSAVIAFVQYLADFTQTFRNVRWLMGSLDVASIQVWRSCRAQRWKALAAALVATGPRGRCRRTSMCLA